MNKIQQNLEISRHVGYHRAKGFTLLWHTTGTVLMRNDVCIKYRSGAWRVYEVKEGEVQRKQLSKHETLLLALKSVH